MSVRPFWVSWYEPARETFEYHGPWWISGWRLALGDDADDVPTICAAVMAKDEDDARRIILEAHDKPRPKSIEWRFVHLQPAKWSPFCDRFVRARWMKWPWPKPEGST